MRGRWGPQNWTCRNNYLHTHAYIHGTHVHIHRGMGRVGTQNTFNRYYQFHSNDLHKSEDAAFPMSPWLQTNVIMCWGVASPSHWSGGTSSTWRSHCDGGPQHVPQVGGTLRGNGSCKGGQSQEKHMACCEHVTVMWYVTIMWHGHVTVMWPSCDMGMWLSCDMYMQHKPVAVMCGAHLVWVNHLGWVKKVTLDWLHNHCGWLRDDNGTRLPD